MLRKNAQVQNLATTLQFSEVFSPVLILLILRVFISLSIYFPFLIFTKKMIKKPDDVAYTYLLTFMRVVIHGLSDWCIPTGFMAIVVLRCFSKSR